MLKTKYPILLASKSPRRQEILSKSGFDFTVIDQDSDEIVPEDTPIDDVPSVVSKSKLISVGSKVHDNIVICADTVVVLFDEILTKPATPAEAQRMLSRLSGNTHRVLTGVSIGTPEGDFHLTDETTVRFKTLENWEIDFYIKNWQPFDKAGSYGVQEFLGMVAITEMHGSYYNVMGLPVHSVYEVLNQFVRKG